MTILELLTIPGLDGTDELDKMLEESERKLERNILSQRLAMAMMYGHETGREDEES